MKKLISILGAAIFLLSACTPAAPAAPTATVEPVQTATVSPATAVPEQPTVTVPAATPTAGGEAETLTILTHDSFSASEGVIASFEKKNNVKLSL